MSGKTILSIAQNDEFTWPYLIGQVFQYKRELLAAQMVAILAVIAHVPIPLLLPLLVDQVLLDKPGKLVGFMNSIFPVNWHGPVMYILFILLITIILRISSMLLDVLQTRQFTLIAKDITYQMRRKLLLCLQQVSMAEYETLGSGAVSSHFVTDINAIDDYIGLSISKTLISVLTLVGISSVLLWLHWQLALFILLMNPMVIYFTVVLGKKVKKLKHRENTAFELFQQALVETLDTIQQLRASNREQHYIKAVIAKARDIKSHSAAFSWKSDAANRFSLGIFLIGFESFRAIGMLMVVFSDLSIGEMMAVFGYLWFMMNPVQEVLNIQYAYFSAKAALSRLNRLLHLQQEPHYPHLHNPFKGKTTTGIRVENICFSYGSENEPVLNNVNLNIKPGEKIALVGASGGGKSTLVQVILGMYPAQSGMLYFDNAPITEIGLDIVRNHVATVLQHPAMFNDTVRMNLTLGQRIDDQKLWEVIEVAQLRDVIEDMPDQLDTIIGHHGIRLSGGQQQRLAIARMLLIDPQVIILDEATSALDTSTESHLHTALNKYLEGRTTLIIAHRLSAVKQADRVYVFEDGHIIEEGIHEELIRSNGLYSKLYGKQQH